jgi:hypothetical protein
MTREAPKKFGKMGYFEKIAFTDKMGEKYGVQKSQFEGNGYTNGGRQENFNDEAYQKAVVKAMANDYDTRRSIESAQSAGNKKAQGLGKGINNLSEAVAAERFMAKTHTNKLGATGKYTSANDEGNVTNYWVKKAKENEHANLATIDDMNGLKADMAARRDSYQGAAKAPLQKSNELAGAEQRLAGDDSSQSIYGFNNNAAPTDNAPKDAARNFLFDYKSKLKTQVA